MTLKRVFARLFLAPDTARFERRPRQRISLVEHELRRQRCLIPISNGQRTVTSAIA
jgi:hypothetical protein